MFVNATFKETYKSQWFDIMENGAPAAAKPVFERFKDVMRDKYRLADKFLIICSVLDASAAASDSDEFRKLKSLRDNLSHGLENSGISADGCSAKTSAKIFNVTHRQAA